MSKGLPFFLFPSSYLTSPSSVPPFFPPPLPPLCHSPHCVSFCFLQPPIRRRRGSRAMTGDARKNLAATNVTFVQSPRSTLEASMCSGQMHMTSLHGDSYSMQWRITQSIRKYKDIFRCVLLSQQDITMLDSIGEGIILYMYIHVHVHNI